MQDTVEGVQANAGSSAPSQAATGSGHSREMPSARSTSIRQAPRADRGLASQASGPRVRPPPTGTHRLPPARAPSAPAIRSGRKVGVVWHGWSGCGKRWGSFGACNPSANPAPAVAKTPPQPLPTRGRGSVAADRLPKSRHLDRLRIRDRKSGRSQVKPLPLVGRGWGGDFVEFRQKSDLGSRSSRRSFSNYSRDGSLLAAQPNTAKG